MIKISDNLKDIFIEEVVFKDARRELASYIHDDEQGNLILHYDDIGQKLLKKRMLI